MSNILCLAQTQPTTAPIHPAIGGVILLVGLLWLVLSANAISRRKLYEPVDLPAPPVPNPPVALLGILCAAIATFFLVPGVYVAVTGADLTALTGPAGKRSLIALDLVARVAATAAAVALLWYHGLFRNIVLPAPRSRFPLSSAAVTYLLAIPWVFLISIIVDQIVQRPDLEHDLFNLWRTDVPGPTPFKLAAIVSAVVVAPLAEELIFRGLLQRLFASLTGRPAVAVFLASLAFALVHQPWPLQPPVFVLSLFLGMAYLRTGSLLVPILAHALFNGIQVLLFAFVIG